MAAHPKKAAERTRAISARVEYTHVATVAKFLKMRGFSKTMSATGAWAFRTLARALARNGHVGEVKDLDAAKRIVEEYYGAGGDNDAVLLKGVENSLKLEKPEE